MESLFNKFILHLLNLLLCEIIYIKREIGNLLLLLLYWIIFT